MTSKYLQIAIVNGPDRQLPSQGALSLLMPSFPQTPLTPDAYQIMDPNLALSLLSENPHSSSVNSSHNAPTTHQELHAKTAQSGGFSATAQQAPAWIPPATWNPGWRRGHIYRVEDLICPRCAPWGMVCSCSPPGSGNAKTIRASQLCCTVL